MVLDFRVLEALCEKFGLRPSAAVVGFHANTLEKKTLKFLSIFIIHSI